MPRNLRPRATRRWRDRSTKRPAISARNGVATADCRRHHRYRLRLRRIADCARHTTGERETQQSTAMTRSGRRQTHRSRVKFGGKDLRSDRKGDKKYERGLASQSFQFGPGAGANRQPTCDTVATDMDACNTLDTGLLRLPVGRYRFSRRRSVEQRIAGMATGQHLRPTGPLQQL